ncbi:MAG: hypothetical protein H6983_10525 [Ectothiorhodospiraceae bacterium]|nr:hypothetical protein [Chromatiales bacterium]MCP5154591.1 hypothetical protein [Ectothiorhodospiraceae bacterium]
MGVAEPTRLAPHRAARRGVCLALGAALLALAGALPWNAALAARISDVTNTRHNLSASGPGPVKATQESQICVFCHTPHAAEAIPGAPLWNRKESGATYTPYTSSTIDADDIAATPGGSSKLCLSCHDGTLAIGAVNVANGQTDVTIQMTGTAAGGTMNAGAGEGTGFTRRLGVDLTNDHPISFTYDSALATADGELRDPVIEGHIATRVSGVKPLVPLENGKLECTSCHDPHIRDDALPYSIKFLRLNRFQTATPVGSSFNENVDIVCLACHDKLGAAWAGSAHASSAVADERYKDSAATQREFPLGMRVWEASCLNCHDTHTVEGARRLLREGTDSVAFPKDGGSPALEETCYQCHTTAASSALQDTTEVPDIETDFGLDFHMPITNADQVASEEAHTPLDADLTESQGSLGHALFGGTLDNRHAECTDCHNPHRVMKNRLFNGTGATVAGTHTHASGHTNIASGVLRGGFGVEPLYGSASFHALPTGYVEKKGDGGTGASTAVTSPWVTREYQICLKCHSDYGYTDNNVYPIGNRPSLGDSGGGTNTTDDNNGLTQFTNQAREFQSPTTHQGEVSRSDGGAGANYTTNNHRSWHPVMRETGRTASIRDMSSSTNLFLSPWNGTNIGTQTMYCSDCHGSNTAPGTVVPNGGENGDPWGPHGSQNEFILKGPWNASTGSNDSGLCFRCHNHTNYATDQNENEGANFASGFGGSKDSNLHAFHAKRIGRMRCMWCHVAVPHGWKNKALLVNLNDRGPEAGSPTPAEFAIDSSGDAYTQEPYYFNAKLKVRTFARSGNWSDSNCGSAGTSQPGNDTQFGKDWMQDVCSSPP